MKNVKNVALATTGLAVLSYSELVSAQIQVDTGNAQTVTSQGTLVTTINQWLGILLNFLYIIAVLYGIYGGFLILTAAGEDEKVTKGKKVIMNAIIGLAVIFLVGLLMRFVIQLLMGNVPA